MVSNWVRRGYSLDCLAGERPVEHPCAYVFALDEGVGLEAVEDFLDDGEGNAHLDGQLVDLLEVEHRALHREGPTELWKILSMRYRFSS